MILEFSPHLSDEDIELLESELGQIAHELCIEGVDVAGIEYEGSDLFTELDLFHEDGREDDPELAGYARQILETYDELQAKGSSLTKDFDRLRARVGRVFVRPAGE